MFNDSTEVNISGRNILNHANRDINIMYQRLVPKRYFELLMEYVAIGALHSSCEVSDAPKCPSGTRVAILDSVFRWATEPVYTSGIQWVHGSAGSGKSRLLRRLAEMLGQHRLLLASFFFSRRADRRNKADYLISTIAYQIARATPSTRPHIERAIENDPLIFCQSPDAQAEALIVLPITQAYQEGGVGKGYPHIIVVDGIDKCEGKTKQQQVLRVLKKVLMVPMSIAFLIASRPETHIVAAFDSDFSESCIPLALENFDEVHKEGWITADDAVIKPPDRKSNPRIPQFSSTIIPTKSPRLLRASPGDAYFAEANKVLSEPDTPTNRTRLKGAITSYTKAIDEWGPAHANYPTALVNRALARLWLWQVNGIPDADTLQKIISDNHTALKTWQETNIRSEAYFQACRSLETAYRLLQPISTACLYPYKPRFLF